MSIDTPALTDEVEATDADAAESPEQAPTAELAEEALVEEVSIDGMCGVY